MRKFKIKVNNTSYEVEVEEMGVNPQTSPATSAPVASTSDASDTNAPAGSTEVVAPMPGNILNVKVQKGDTVAKDDVLLILEAMKMENEIKAPKAGKIVAVIAQKGSTVNSGDLLIAIS